MKIYVAINTEIRNGDDPEFFVLGTYSTMEDAINTLERQAKDDMNMYEEEDVEDFKRTDFYKGHFTLANDYDTYEYRVEEYYLDNKKDEEG